MQMNVAEWPQWHWTREPAWPQSQHYPPTLPPHVHVAGHVAATTCLNQTVTLRSWSWWDLAGVKSQRMEMFNLRYHEISS